MEAETSMQHCLVLFAAEDQKEHDRPRNSVHLDCHSDIPDVDDLSGDQHHRRTVYSVGRGQQLCSDWLIDRVEV